MAKAVTKRTTGAAAKAPVEVKAADSQQDLKANPQGTPEATPVSDASTRWLAIAVLVLAMALLMMHGRVELQTKIHWLVGDAPNRSTGGIDCRNAHAHLTDVMPVQGFHVLCIQQTPLDTLLITGFKDGMRSNHTIETAMDVTVFRFEVENMLDIVRPADEFAAKYWYKNPFTEDDQHAYSFKQPYAFFTPDGERLDSKLSSLVDRVVFLFEGGQFIWPGVKVGHKRIIKDLYDRGDVEMETLSMTPLVFSVEEFLKDDEIDIIMELSLPHLKPSGVTLNDGHENRPATDWRTSTTYFLPSTAHEVVQNIDRRTADLVKVPITHQEFVQVLRYEATQKYDHHLDIFSVERHKNNRALLEEIEYGFKNRMITVFWYMSDVAKGGHTIFPRAGGLPPPHSMKDCSVGLKVPPKKRKVIVFYSMLPNGATDPMSLHGGCPVEDGIKYSGNKWVWNKPRRFIVEN